MTLSPHILPALAATLIALATTAPLQVKACGAEDHRVIAEAADRNLTPAARAEVIRLLAAEPGATFASISTWADDIRSPNMAAWHYLNFPRDADCVYDSDRSCIPRSCVVGAIERQLGVLRSTQSDDIRLKALKYVVHFVTDGHQPLHGGFADDRGGNSYQLQAFGMGTNLHALWDSALIQQWEGGPAALRDSVAAESLSTELSLNPAAWAEESCKIAATAGFYPNGRTLEIDYLQRWGPVLLQRLAAGGKRLDAVLNGALLPR